MKTALLAGLLAAGAAVAAPTSPPEWSAPTDPFRVADNLYYVGTAGISAWLITTPGGHIVIDGAMPTSAPLIQSSIRRLGFEPKDVKLLLNTHAHFDHTGGLADLKRDTGARLQANPADRKALESGTYPGWEENRGLDFAPVKVDADLADGRPVKLGGAVLKRIQQIIENLNDGVAYQMDIKRCVEGAEFSGETTNLFPLNRQNRPWKLRPLEGRGELRWPLLLQKD